MFLGASNFAEHDCVRLSFDVKSRQKLIEISLGHEVTAIRAVSRVLYKDQLQILQELQVLLLCISVEILVSALRKSSILAAFSGGRAEEAGKGLRRETPKALLALVAVGATGFTVRIYLYFILWGFEIN